MVRTRWHQVTRALRLRCPLCGTRWPRRRWLQFAPECPVCQLQLERNEGDFFLGSYTLNLFATLLFAVLLTIANVRWQQLPGGVRVAGSLLAIAGFTLVFYPFSKMLWLVVDIQFRPPIERDFGDGTGA